MSVPKGLYAFAAETVSGRLSKAVNTGVGASVASDSLSAKPNCAIAVVRSFRSSCALA